MYKHMLCFLAVVFVLCLAVPAHASTETILYSFCSLQGCIDGANPVADLVADGMGNLYGTTSAGGSNACLGGCGLVFVLCAPGTIAPPAPCVAGQQSWREFVIHDFMGGSNGGATPLAGLLLANNTLYGTTSAGGSGACSGGCGIVFSLKVDGSSYQILHFFSGFPNLDGANPTAELLLDTAGNLYGTTPSGGITASICAAGCGTVFSLQPTIGTGYTYSVLYRFAGKTDGANPAAGLTFDGASPANLWGTALNGGKKGVGAIFELESQAPSYTFKLIHTFTGAAGANPAAALIFDSGVNGGYLYGTTRAGGSKNCTGGCGTVFQLKPEVPTDFRLLHSFTGGKDGEAPVARLAIDTDASDSDIGSLYGTASLGGLTSGCIATGCGTAFEICPSTPERTCQKGDGWVGDEYRLIEFNGDGASGMNAWDPTAGFLLLPAGLDAQAGINPFQTGRGGCSSNCVATSNQGGSGGGGGNVISSDGSGGAGTVYQLTN